MMNIKSNFFNRNITLEQRKYAWHLVKNAHLGDRGDGTDGNKEMQYVGILGEICFIDIMGMQRPRSIKEGFDDGIDFTINGIKIDVKTMSRNYFFKKNWVNNIFASQVKSANYKNDYYVFCNINKKELCFEIIGWIRKYQLNERNKHINLIDKDIIRKRDDGTTFKARADMYEITMKALEPYLNLKMALIQGGGLILRK